MLNKEEKEILFSYPLMESIGISDYIIDFVMKNPSNYPISSTIMKFTKYKNETTLKSYYTRENIRNCISSLYNIYDTNEGRFEHQHNFTSILMYILLMTGVSDCRFTIIEKNDNDIWVAVGLNHTQYMFIFNSNCTSGLYVITSDDYYYFMINLVNKSVTDALDSEIIHRFFKFPTDVISSIKYTTEMDDYLVRYELLMRFLSGRAVTNLTLDDKSAEISNYYSNACDERSIMYIIKHDQTYDITLFSKEGNKCTDKIKYQQEIAKDADPLFDKYI